MTLKEVMLTLFKILKCEQSILLALIKLGRESKVSHTVVSSSFSHHQSFLFYLAYQPVSAVSLVPLLFQEMSAIIPGTYLMYIHIAHHECVANMNEINNKFNVINTN